MIIRRCFSSFYNILFYSQEAFGFHHLTDFCNFHDHFVTFFLSFFFVPFSLFYSLERFWYLLQAFLINWSTKKLIKFLDIFIYMKRKIIKEVIRNFINNGFIGKHKNSLLNYSFVMIDIIHKLLVLLKNPLNILKIIFVQK